MKLFQKVNKLHHTISQDYSSDSPTKIWLFPSGGLSSLNCSIAPENVPPTDGHIWALERRDRATFLFYKLLFSVLLFNFLLLSLLQNTVCTS